jgi:hypothetical protein
MSGYGPRFTVGHNTHARESGPNSNTGLPPKPRDHWPIAQRFCVPAQRTRAPVQTCRDSHLFDWKSPTLCSSLWVESVSVARDWTSSDWRYTHTIGNPRAKKNLRRHQCRSVVNANYYYRVYTNCRTSAVVVARARVCWKTFCSYRFADTRILFLWNSEEYHSSCLLRLYKKFF